MIKIEIGLENSPIRINQIGARNQVSKEIIFKAAEKQTILENPPVSKEIPDPENQ